MKQVDGYVKVVGDPSLAELVVVGLIKPSSYFNQSTVTSVLLWTHFSFSFSFLSQEMFRTETRQQMIQKLVSSPEETVQTNLR